MKRTPKVIVGFAASVVILASAAGCNKQSNTNVASVTPQESLCSAKDQQLAADRGYDSNTVKFAMANGYYGWCIPEYDDDQRFSDGDLTNKDYGPVAHVLAPPWLDTLHINASFVQVAIIAVEPESDASPAPYNDLGLGQFNCVYLRRPSSGNAKFDALIVPPSGLQCPGAPTSGGPSLGVSVEQLAGEASANYPPTTRFIEAGDGHTLIGVRCENRWCAVGRAVTIGAPASMAPSAGAIPPSAHDALASFNYAQAKVKGWFDDQWLGVPDANPRHKIHRQIRASAIPDPKLGNLTLHDFVPSAGAGDYQTVGSAYFASEPDPSSKYAKVFGFSAGINSVGMRGEVHQTGSKTDTVWFTRVINARGDTTNNIPTMRMDHSKFFGSVYGESAKIPATMRWRWSDKDEDLWAECDGGCCRAGIK